MASKNLICTGCGVAEFMTLQGLFSHQRSGRCQRRAPEAAAIATSASVPFVAAFGEGAPPIAIHDDDLGVAIESSRDGVHTLDGEGGSVGFNPSVDWFSMSGLERDDNAPLLPFDSTFHLINFMRNCKNKEGLSRHDIQALLDLVSDARFDTKTITVKNADDVERYEEKVLYSEHDGWTKHSFDEVTTGDADLYYKDPIQVLNSLFSAPENSENFKLSPHNQASAGENIFTTPDTGYWWTHMQAHIDCTGSAIAPLIFYSDQTSLSNNQRIQGYPLVMTIGNISCENRREDAGHALLAILPTFQGSNLSHFKKMEYLHKCLETILQPLKEASFKGLSIVDPNGTVQYVYPLLYAYICDHPEGCKITGTYDTNMCQSPCSVCMCGKNDLNCIQMRYPYRTEAKMKEVWHAMKELPKNLAEEMSKTWSLHPIECALWNFNGGNTEFGNPYRAIHVDVLHQSDIGIFKMLVGIIREIASLHPRAQILRELDSRLLYVKHNCRFPAFRIPGNEQGGYFMSQANFAGFEHRSIMQVIVLCMVGLFDDNVISAVVLFLEWYKMACRSTSHNINSLQQMDEMMYRAVEALKGALSDFQRSGFNTIKVHMMSHFSSCIKRSGLPWEYSTDMFEQFHIALMKSGYRSSNRRNATPQIVRHNKRLESLRKAAKQIEGVERHVIGKETPLNKALMTGENVMSNVYINIHQTWLHARHRNLSQTPHASINDICMGRGYDVACISKGVQQILLSQPEIQGELLQALATFESLKNVTMSQVLGLSRSLAIPPGFGDKFGDWPMYARGTPNFHGRPWFSNVAFELEGDGAIPRICYGEIRLLFQGTNQSINSREINKMKVHLAFLKLYTEIDTSHDVWSAVTKCTELRWATQSNLRDVQNSVRRNQVLDLRPRYMVLEIQIFLKVVHIIPNFAVEGNFFVNRWKF